MAKWTFAANHDGEEHGFHDAGVETYKGNLERYLAREAIQNSLDARDHPTKPVSVQFEKLELEARSIPDLPGLAETFRLCAKYWNTDEKAKDFFKRAESLAKQKKVTVLRIGDYNTTGVLGGDKERTKNWYNLVRCSGSSSKWGGEGGSFGIGKNAPFAASRMRTVLYSTLNSDGESIFQGVARLVTHQRPRKGTVQATGFYGNDTGGSVRDRRKIMKRYLRTKQGTDLYILGYHADVNWNTDLIYSVLENFWPAICFADLEVQIGTTKIAKDNLGSLLASYSGKEDFTAHLFYQAFTDSTIREFTKTLPTLKEATVKLFTGNPDLPRKVAMVRKTGMVIYQKQFKSVLPFCGVFLCRNDEGNQILRDMEPPRHDEWDQDHPEKGAHRKTANEFAAYIRDCIKELAPVDSQKVLLIPELSQYLPDDDDSPEPSFEGNPEDSLVKREGLENKPKETEIRGRTMERKPPARPDSVKPDDGELETEEEGTGDAGGGGGRSGGGGGSGGGANGEEDAEAKKAKKGGKSAAPPIPVRFRVFPKDADAGTYSVTVHAESRPAGTAMLSIAAVGDDSSMAVEIESAKLNGGKKIEIQESGKLGPVAFPQRGPLRLEIVLKQPERLAMEVEAHEA